MCVGVTLRASLSGTFVEGCRKPVLGVCVAVRAGVVCAVCVGVGWEGGCRNVCRDRAGCVCVGYVKKGERGGARCVCVCVGGGYVGGWCVCVCRGCMGGVCLCGGDGCLCGGCSSVGCMVCVCVWGGGGHACLWGVEVFVDGWVCSSGCRGRVGCVGVGGGGVLVRVYAGVVRDVGV